MSGHRDRHQDVGSRYGLSHSSGDSCHTAACHVWADSNVVIGEGIAPANEPLLKAARPTEIQPKRGLDGIQNSRSALMRNEPENRCGSADRLWGLSAERHREYEMGKSKPRRLDQPLIASLRAR